jgi:hypothetical protein
MSEPDNEWDEGGFDADGFIEDRFSADVSTVDALDTLDVSAQFFKVCARIYADNPLHAPVYQWLSRLPRTSKGNIKAISEHLALALRLYVDSLDAGVTLRVGMATDHDGHASSPAGSTRQGGHTDSGRARSVGGGAPSAPSPSQRYQHSRQFRESVSLDPVTQPSPSRSPSDSGDQHSQVPLTERRPPASSVSPSPKTIIPPPASSQTPASPAPENPSSSEDGLSYVARLAQKGEGW